MITSPPNEIAVTGLLLTLNTTSLPLRLTLFPGARTVMPFPKYAVPPRPAKVFTDTPEGDWYCRWAGKMRWHRLLC